MNNVANNIKNYWNTKIWVKGQRKYIGTLIFFVIWMLFIDQNRVSNIMKIHRSIDKIENSISFYKSETKKIVKDKRDLDQNKERYAREKYLMHKNNEEVFVLQNK